MASVSVDDFDFFSIFPDGAFEVNDVAGQVAQGLIAQAVRPGIPELNFRARHDRVHGVTVLNRPATRNRADEQDRRQPRAPVFFELRHRFFPSFPESV